jgi:hypothetical protein
LQATHKAIAVFFRQVEKFAACYHQGDALLQIAELSVTPIKQSL